MRVLIVGCDKRAVFLLRRMRLQRSLWPLQMCFWDRDVEAAKELLKAVGAGMCLREITPALLVHVDVALVFDETAALPRRAPLPAIMRMDAEGTVTLVQPASQEQRIVADILRRAL